MHDSYRVGVGDVSGSVVVGNDNTVTTHIAVERMYLPALRGPSDTPRRFDPRPAEVTGRDPLLAEIAERFAAPTGVVCIALVGLGGVGKTTAAVEYAYRSADAYHVIWHVHAQSDTTLRDGFDRLAEALGLADEADPRDAVHAHLARTDRPWLLIFDNAPDDATIRPWLPGLGDGHVLVTTRDGGWPAGQRITVGAWDTATATRFLLAHARPDDRDEAAAEAIATHLGGLPLALAQAVGYLESTGAGLDRYRTLLTNARSVVLSRDAPAAHPEPVTATWSLAVATIARTMPEALTLLRLLACMAPDDIPVRLILSRRNRTPYPMSARLVFRLALLRRSETVIDDAVRLLGRHSLVTITGDTVGMHRLVQATTLDRLSPRQRKRWRLTAHGLIDAVVPDDVHEPSSWTTCQALLPHARQVCDPCSPTLRRLVSHLGPAGKGAASLAELGALVAAYTDRFGPEHVQTLSVRVELAHWTGIIRDAAAARDMYAELVPLSVRHYGPLHRNTLAARTSLARWTATAGDESTAAGMFDELLPLWIRLRGPDHSDTLTTRAMIAERASRTGDPAARDALAELLRIRERVKGPEDINTLWTRTAVAQATGNAGDAVAARDLLAEVTSVWRRVYGPEHPLTTVTQASLAYWTSRTGDYAAARDIMAPLVPLAEAAYGPDDPEALVVRASLASWTGQAGDAAGARDMYADLLPIRVRTLGPEHPDTLTTRANLATWTGWAGDPATARDMFAELLSIRVRVLGPDHADTQNARTRLEQWTKRAAPGATS
jgi:hypothetical protein